MDGVSYVVDLWVDQIKDSPDHPGSRVLFPVQAPGTWRFDMVEIPNPYPEPDWSKVREQLTSELHAVLAQQRARTSPGDAGEA